MGNMQRTPSSSKFLFKKHAPASVTRSGTNVFLHNARKTKCQRSTEFFKRKNFDGAGCLQSKLRKYSNSININFWCTDCWFHLNRFPNDCFYPLYIYTSSFPVQLLHIFWKEEREKLHGYGRFASLFLYNSHSTLQS